MDSSSRPCLGFRAKASAVLALLMGSITILAQDTSPSGPTLDGIAWNCSGWHTVVSGDSCYSLEQTFNITAAEFLEWNPAVSSDCSSNFWSGYSYCVRVGAPGPTLDGIASNCDAWHTVVSGDSCYSLEQAYNITAAEFLEWNTAVSSDCSSNFWAGYSYCVGVDPGHSTTATSSTATATSTSTQSSITTKSSSTSSAQTSTAIRNATTPYSTRYPITSFNLTAPYTATALPPQRTLSGQPSYCNAWRQVSGGDTCESIVNLYKNRLTSEQLLEYNPTIGDDCGGLYVGWYVCVGVQSQNSTRVGWYTTQTNFTEPVSTAYPGYTATVVANFTASPQQTGIPSDCSNYYQAQTDDTCTSVLAEYNYVTEEQFFAWNPALDGDCQGLWAGYYYCVASYTNSSDLPMPPTVTTSASPTATGTVSSCEKWYMTTVNDDCAAVAAWFGTFSEADFISWNPSVGSSCGSIQQDTYYCVGIPGTPTTRPQALTTSEIATEPTQTGIAANCTELWLVSSTDTCDSIISSNDIASDDFFAWNPAVGTNCTGLAANYYVCVSTSIRETIAPVSTVTITAGVSSTVHTSAASASTGTGTAATAATSAVATAVSTPSPYMPGMVDNCVRFFFRGSDAADLYCFDIAADAGIALSDFYTWNPQVGSDCSNLWADTWYCIGIQGPATTISTGVPSPAAKT